MTSPSITVAVPILDRPGRIVPFADACRHARVQVLFLPDPTDSMSLEVLHRSGLPFALAPPAEAFGVPTYASKVNHAYRVTDTPFILYAGDDLAPRDTDWPTLALRHLANERVGVLSTNDAHHRLNRLGVLATHGIIRRSYIEHHGTASLPDAGPVFSEAYRHAGPDVEVSVVALRRNAFRHAPDVVLEHRHYRAGKAPRDSTYRLGQLHLAADRERMNERLPEWAFIREHARTSHQPPRHRKEAA